MARVAGDRRPRGADRLSSAEAAGLYLHVPFCVRACPYCDFDFVAGRVDPDAVAAWRAGLEREWAGGAALVGDSLYLGGGTPSAIGARALAEVIEWARERVLGGVPLREATVELNPEHVDAELIASLRASAIDRVSLGVQTLSPLGLAQLGRVHDAERAHAAVSACVGAGLRTSVDLIVGWPGQTSELARADVEGLAQLGIEHVSVYALTIEPDTPWPKLVRRGLRVMPQDDEQARLLLEVEHRLVELGFVHYEVASYARPDAEAYHNGKYWRGVDVVGLGPSAASVEHSVAPAAFEVRRRRNRRGLERWLDDPLAAEEPLDVLVGDAAAGEALWLALRRLDGLDVHTWLARTGRSPTWLEGRIAAQLQRGNLHWRGSVLAVAPDRWLLHDLIAADLL